MPSRTHERRRPRAGPATGGEYVGQRLADLDIHARSRRRNSAASLDHDGPVYASPCLIRGHSRDRNVTPPREGERGPRYVAGSRHCLPVPPQLHAVSTQIV